MLRGVFFGVVRTGENITSGPDRSLCKEARRCSRKGLVLVGRGYCRLPVALGVLESVVRRDGLG